LGLGRPIARHRLALEAARCGGFQVFRRIILAMAICPWWLRWASSCAGSRQIALLLQPEWPCLVLLCWRVTQVLIPLRLPSVVS